MWPDNWFLVNQSNSIVDGLAHSVQHISPDSWCAGFEGILQGPSTYYQSIPMGLRTWLFVELSSHIHLLMYLSASIKKCQALHKCVPCAFMTSLICPFNNLWGSIFLNPKVCVCLCVFVCVCANEAVLPCAFWREGPLPLLYSPIPFSYILLYLSSIPFSYTFLLY